MRETAVIVHRARVPCIVYARSAIIRRFRSSFPVFFRFSCASALSRLGYARGISAILFLPFSSCRDLRNSFPRELPASVANWITNVSTTRPATVSGVACSRRKFKSPRNWVLTRDLTGFAASLSSSFPFLRSSVLSADKTRTFLPAGLILRVESAPRVADPPLLFWSRGRPHAARPPTYYLWFVPRSDIFDVLMKLVC